MEKQNQIIACTTSGRPLTQEQYINKINTAIAQAENGELLTDEELQQEIATW